MDLTSIANVLDWSRKSEDDEYSGGGVFIVLPNNLAKKYPKEGRKGHDSSPPHITVLYIEDSKSKEKLKGKYFTAVENVCKKTKPFNLKLGQTKNLVNDKKETVYYSEIVSNKLENFNTELKKEFDKSKLVYSKAYKTFKPHVTIEYVEEEEESKYGNKNIQGSWEVSFIWLWGFGEPNIIFLGG